MGAVLFGAGDDIVPGDGPAGASHAKGGIGLVAHARLRIF
jgi:hypothetical protein